MIQYPLIRPVLGSEELDNIRLCLESGYVTQGPFVSRFEEAFAKEHNVKHAIAVTSCTAALHLAMLALGITEGDEVLVPAFSWVSTANAVEYVGARPVFVDVCSDDFNLDVELLERHITEKTKAIIAVHLFGAMASMQKIQQLAEAHGLYVVEDAACATGADYHGAAAGSLGDIGCFSFHPRKVITTGEGGMLTTNSDALATRICMYRNHGITPNALPHNWQMPEITACGFNYRMSDLQAAVGIAQMGKLTSILDDRKRVAMLYHERLSGQKMLQLPSCVSGAAHTWQSYVVTLVGAASVHRNDVIDKLQALGIQTRPGTHAIPRLSYYAEKYRLEADRFPVAILCEDTTITLPVFHEMNEEQVEYICQGLLEACRDM